MSTEQPTTPYTSVPLHSEIDEHGEVTHSSGEVRKSIVKDIDDGFKLDKPTLMKILKYSAFTTVIGILFFLLVAILITNSKLNKKNFFLIFFFQKFCLMFFLFLKVVHQKLHLVLRVILKFNLKIYLLVPVQSLKVLIMEQELAQ